MITSFHTKNLANYFRRSGRFYYTVIDLQGNFIYVNPLFQEQFSHIATNFYGKKAASIFSEADSDKFKQALQQCLQNPGAASQVDLHILSASGVSQLASWELSATLNEEAVIESFQAIGFVVYEPGHTMAGIGNRIVEMEERYKAYEHNIEGLWKFELKIPIHQSPLPQELVDHCRKYSVLTECNDNMARMYGYEKAEDFIGTAVADILDFSDETRVEKIREFIANGFRSILIETKEFDRFGNTKYFLNKMEGTVEDGMLKKIWGTQQDITEQRLAEENNKYLANIVETISDIIISQDKEFNIVSWNKAAETVYGYSAGEMIGKKINEVLYFEFQGISRTLFFEKLYENGGWSGEATVTNRAGRQLTVLTTITTIQNSKKERTGYVSVSKDITERKKTEDQLRQQAAILSNVSDLIMTTDFNHDILSWNKKAEEVTGYSAEEAVGKFLGEIIRPDYGSSSPELSFAVLNQNGFWQGEISFFNKPGIKKHILHTATYLLDEAGHRIAVIGTGKDITERKKAEEQLQQSELFYRNLFANSLDGVLLTDKKGNIIFASPSITPILGYSSDEVMGKNTFDYAHPDDKQLALSAFMDELKDDVKHKFISVRLLKKSGEWIWCVIRGHNLIENPHIQGMVVYFYDDTLRKETEAALIESEYRFRNQATVLTNVTDVIVTTDLNRLVTSWNKVTERLTGISEKYAIGKQLKDILEIDYSPYTTDQVVEIILNERIWQGEISFIGIKGEKIYLLHTGSLLQNDEGQKIGFLGVGKDITERKKAEDKLRESEENFRNLIYNLKQGVILQDKYGVMTICNKAALDMLGLSEQQLLGKASLDPFWNVIHEDGKDFPRITHPVTVVFQTKKSVLDVVMGVYRPVTNDRVWLLVNAEPVLGNDGEIVNVVCSFADITEQKRLSKELIEQEVQKQKQLTQATIDGQEKERLQVGKELHDNISQHLTTTRLYLEVAREKATGEVLEMINLSHKTLADIINEIRHLSQSLVPPTLGDIGVIESIHDLCDSLKRAHKFNIDFYSRYFNEEGLQENLKLMLFRIIQEQVNNIVRHAKADALQIKLQSDAEYIILTISDDGVGFDPANYKKGLGISNISNRAGLFNGKVEIDTAPGKGCSLSVIIPIETSTETGELI